MKRALFLYFLFGWAVVLSALSLVMGSTEVLVMFLVLAISVFIGSQLPKKKPVSLAEYRARRIQKLSANSIHGNANASGRVNVHR